MARVIIAEEVGEDFERFLDHLRDHGVTHSEDRLDDIVDAIDILVRHPLLGRKTSSDLRELVIGRDSRGYVALYRYIEELDTVFILAIRSQREAGYARD